MSENLLIIAHRGASGYCQDNTHQSIQTSIDMGIKIIEIDIRLTNDFKLVLSHDDTYAKKKIKKTLLQDLGNIVRLKDVLLSTPNDIIFYLDIKCENDEKIFITKINNILEKFPNRIFYIASFSDTFVSLFNRIYSNYHLGIIFEIFNENIYRVLQHKIDFVVNKFTKTNEFITFLEIKDKIKYIYTINDLELITGCVDNIDGIITDYPDILSLN